MKPANAKELIECLATPKTIVEIAVRFPELNSEAKVRALTWPESHALFEQKNGIGQSIFVCVARRPKPTVKPRIWSHCVEERGWPYIWIQFPHDLPFKRLRIVGLSDVHYGAKAHSADRFRRYLKWIAENDDVFAFANGDIHENAIDGSIGGAVYESVMTPDEQLWGKREGDEPGIIELLRPISHKILWAQPGNHEWRTWKKCNIDTTKIFCRELDIPYFSEPIYADILAWGQRFTFYCHHGVSGSGTKGGKLNAADRPSGFQEAVDFIIMGHVHDSMANVESRIERQRTYDDKGEIVDIKLVERPQHVVICPSFHGYFESYGSRAGYAPGSWGTVTSVLYPNGTYRTSE